MNMATVIAVYAALCKEMKLPLALSRVNRWISCSNGDDGRRASGQSHRLGG